MWFKIIILTFLISFLPGGNLKAQQPALTTDSTTVYKNIETYSKRNKFNKFIYNLIFRSPSAASRNNESKKRGYQKLIQKPYNTFDGKIIRNIDIVTLDPFGYSVNDTTARKHNFLAKAGNSIHIKTQGIAIRNLLLFHRNQPFRSLLVNESERLIRSQSFIYEVSFYVAQTAAKSDSVDVFIRALDKWSIIPEAAISGSGFHAGITDKNFLGTGQEFKTSVARDNDNGINSFLTNYYIPNIRRTYINTNFHYGFDNNHYFDRSIDVERPFFSPVAKWAAGITLSSRFRKDSLKYADPVYIPQNLRFSTVDFWAGKAIQIFRDNSSSDLETNLILAARYRHVRYKEKPDELYDPLHMFSNEDFYLAEIGISARKYVQDRYIFRFGVVEDVPVGKVYALTGGYQVRQDSRRYYLGMRFSFGNYYQWGYLSSNLEYGTFFNASHAEQGVFTAGINYFSGIFEIGNWKFRQFVKPQVTIGLNRLPYDSLTLKEGYGLDAFNSTSLSGISRMLFTLQTQSYAPWNIFGFHFGPYLTYTAGMLGDAKNGFRSSKVYSQLGLGVLIKNENLLFNTFQISVSFYPLIPGIGQNVFKMNSYRSSDFGFRDFEIGKPSNVIFR